MKRAVFFSSSMAPMFRRYMDLKRALGCDFSDQCQVLHSLDRFLRDSTNHSPDLTSRAFQQWCRTQEKLALDCGATECGRSTTFASIVAAPNRIAFRQCAARKKIRVHAFYCMLGISLLQYIHRKAQAAWAGLSMEQLLEELRQIQQFALLYPKSEKGTNRVALVLSTQTLAQQSLAKELGLDALRLPKEGNTPAAS